MHYLIVPAMAGVVVYVVQELRDKKDRSGGAAAMSLSPTWLVVVSPPIINPTRLLGHGNGPSNWGSSARASCVPGVEDGLQFLKRVRVSKH